MTRTQHHPRPAAFSACFALALALAVLAGNAQAQAIVNIKGFGTDGAGVASPLGYPQAVGVTINLVNPVSLHLVAGDYLLSDAWGLPGASYDAWNYQASASNTWDSHFYVAVQQGTGNGYTLLLDALSLRNPACPNSNCSWSTEAQAAAAFQATPAFHLHLAADTTVSFSSTDYFLPDNLGGMSVLVSSVPEPQRAALMGLGLLALGLRRMARPRA